MPKRKRKQQQAPAPPRHRNTPTIGPWLSQHTAQAQKEELAEQILRSLPIYKLAEQPSRYSSYGAIRRLHAKTVRVFRRDYSEPTKRMFEVIIRSNFVFVTLQYGFDAHARFVTIRKLQNYVIPELQLNLLDSVCSERVHGADSTTSPAELAKLVLDQWKCSARGLVKDTLFSLKRGVENHAFGKLDGNAGALTTHTTSSQLLHAAEPTQPFSNGIPIGEPRLWLRRRITKQQTCTPRVYRFGAEFRQAMLDIPKAQHDILRAVPAWLRSESAVLETAAKEDRSAPDYYRLNNWPIQDTHKASGDYAVITIMNTCVSGWPIHELGFFERLRTRRLRTATSPLPPARTHEPMPSADVLGSILAIVMLLLTLLAFIVLLRNTTASDY